jgi:hypothetical protein
MLDNPFSHSETDDDFKSPNIANFHHDVITSITELQSHRRLTGAELAKMEENMSETKEHLKSLDKSVGEIREMARDAKHISIGVDGRNGLRGTLDHLAKDVGKLKEDVEFVKEAAHSYNGMKVFFSRLLIASFTTVMLQLAAAVWYISAQNAKQEALRSDVNRILLHIDKQGEQTNLKALIK